MTVLIGILAFALGIWVGTHFPHARRESEPAPLTPQEVREMERERKRMKEFLSFDGFDRGV